ncbi:MAG: outer membrane protein assembly factor BamB family protein [Candidatus Zipacnadales bacterium]
MNRGCGWLINGLGLIIAMRLAAGGAGDDWPTYHHDHRRSAVSAESLRFPLSETWRHILRHPPRPGWPEPIEDDPLSRYLDLQNAVRYDRANHVVIAGEALYFGSSADDSVICLDATTGERRWRFFTEGPVRLAPEVVEGRVYFGSDDGCAYCVSAANGTLLWKRRVAPIHRRLPGNGRLISEAPMRTGVLVEGGVAYCLAGLFPTQGVYVCALRAEDGTPIWCKRTERVSPQGYLLASSSRLYVPTGRTPPAIFDRLTGNYLGSVPGEGGTYALLTGGESGEGIAAFEGLHMIVHGGIAYLQAERTLSALDRTRYLTLAATQKRLANEKAKLEARLADVSEESEAAQLREQAARLGNEIAHVRREMRDCTLWRQSMDQPYELILVGDTLLAGGDGEVVAYNVATGQKEWAGVVTGKAYGLAVANGRLYVSTDAGVIHCFTAVEGDTRVVQPSEPANSFSEDPDTRRCGEAAQRLLARTGIRRGYCIVLDSDDGQLAREIAVQSELRVVGVDKEAEKLAAAREALEAAGIYGSQVALLQALDDRLPIASGVANLVVSQEALLTGQLPSPQTLRVLRPYGGVAYLGPDISTSKLETWAEASGVSGLVVESIEGLGPVVRREALPGAGEWTHLYADPGNTACSGDTLTAPLVLQWFGEPGPHSRVGRHDRPMPPLIKDGRVFILANEVVICVDAYNGTVLWELEAPGINTIGASIETGQAVVTDDLLYGLVGEECWGLDVASGEKRLTFTLPPASDDHPRRWGYLGCDGQILVGSSQRRPLTTRGPLANVSGLLRTTRGTVGVSRELFAWDRKTAKQEWSYFGGAIAHATVTLGEGRLYFVENRSPQAQGDEDGTINLSDFCAGETYVVALDQHTGKEIWRHLIELPFAMALYMCYAEGRLVLGGVRGVGPEVESVLYGFEAVNGDKKWESSFRMARIASTMEGGQEPHPCLVGGCVYLRPYAFDLRTGTQLSYVFDRESQGCGRLTAAAKYLFGLGGNPRLYDLSVNETEGVPLTETMRPGCWLNIIPAGGVLIMPEYNSGCTCAYPMQASLCFASADM